MNRMIIITFPMRIPGKSITNTMEDWDIWQDAWETGYARHSCLAKEKLRITSFLLDYAFLIP
ncbi:hypothetical protein GKZ89_17970 [Bacillus mangrovi]|uniref:Uncharacterized protein n=1 Tax=Metabacillus mangrovi TaxID=1491830 RepID=A0A7X2S8R9_9BACI|nr:hypothetical protein [Metabacillus mangrovi]MTH55286.1 hypothetical protein [Metabacillus mangrovi]